MQKRLQPGIFPMPIEPTNFLVMTEGGLGASLVPRTKFRASVTHNTRGRGRHNRSDHFALRQPVSHRTHDARGQ